MRWEDARRSENIEDRRGEEYDGGDGGGPMMGAGGGFGLGTMVILGIIAYALGIDPRILIGGAEMFNNVRGGGQSVERVERPQRPAGQASVPSDQTGQFVAAIVGQNEDVWSEILPEQKGVKFKPPYTGWPPYINALDFYYQELNCQSICTLKKDDLMRTMHSNILVITQLQKQTFIGFTRALRERWF